MNPPDLAIIQLILVEYMCLELSNRLDWVEFVFVANLNGLRNSQPEPEHFIKCIAYLELYVPFYFLNELI